MNDASQEADSPQTAPLVAYSRVIVCVAMFFSILVSSHLWLSENRLYAPFPLLFPETLWLPPPFDKIMYCLLLGLTFWLPFSKRPYNATLWLLGVALVLIVFDMTRLQPWFYLDLLMLSVLAIGNRSKKDAAGSINALRIVIIATYFWAALQKVNSSFFTETVPWFFRSVFPQMPEPITITFASIIIGLEFIQAILLIFRPTRKAGFIMVLLSHFMVLSCVGPSGLNWNKVIWPWNVQMVILVLLLFVRSSADVKSSDILIPRMMPQLIALLVAGIFPLLNFFKMWDYYLSAALYSGNVPQCELTFDMPQDRALPAKLVHQCEIDKTSTPRRAKINMRDLAMVDLNVPPYPERRVLVPVVTRLIKQLNLPNCKVQMLYRARFFEKPFITIEDVPVFDNTTH